MNTESQNLLKIINRRLLPCAHCGSTNVTLRRTIDTGAVCWHVECLNCGIHTLKFDETNERNDAINTPNSVATAMCEAIDYACDVWNKRANNDNVSVPIVDEQAIAVPFFTEATDALNKLTERVEKLIRTTKRKG